MKCPYCDDNIHPMAKFCPKCGLPLKEDTTLMGSNNNSYLVDDSGPNMWVLVGGAAAIVVVALTIGWLTGQGQHKNETVVRQPLTPASMGGARALSSLPALPSYGWGVTTASPVSANYHPNVRWVYVPPAQSTRPLPPQPAVLGPRPEDMPPPNMGVMLALSEPPRRPPVVTAVVPVEPISPPVAVMAYAPAFAVPGASFVDTSPAGPLTTVQAPGETLVPEMAGREDPRSDWVYDPVQERWAMRADRAQVYASPHVLVRPPTRRR